MEATPTLLQNWLKHHAEYEAAGRKLAIYIGPGGNAGAIAGGLITAMYQLKALLPSATYIGSSVGAYSWLYTLVTEDHRAPTLFGTSFTTSAYFSPLRLFSSRPALNLDYVVHEVLETHVPMNYAAAAKSPFNIQALTTNAAGQPHLLPLTGISKSQVQTALKATASMPLVGRIHNLENLSMWDGWLAEPHLLNHLKNLGVTDVVWLLNRPLTAIEPLPVRLVWANIIARSTRINPAFANLIQQRLNAGDFLASPPNGMNLEIFHPHVNLGGSIRNPAPVFHALGTSYRHMGTYLGHPNLAYPTEWAPWLHHMPS
ncbi:MAG: hypothetical protein EON60_06430 [Alphaproteobacteria bacterium]|nr:MAG: hypothetical protein EON60_06430 [Alphaproteobacteria bacterium]